MTKKTKIKWSIIGGITIIICYILFIPLFSNKSIIMDKYIIKSDTILINGEIRGMRINRVQELNDKFNEYHLSLDLIPVQVKDFAFEDGYIFLCINGRLESIDRGFFSNLCYAGISADNNIVEINTIKSSSTLPIKAIEVAPFNYSESGTTQVKKGSEPVGSKNSSMRESEKK